MRLIEPDERQDFVAALQRHGLAEGDFELLEWPTLDFNAFCDGRLVLD